MKEIIKFLAVTIAIVLMSAQPSSACCAHDKDSHDRMRAERVAYLTAAMDLTPAEAEKFWPVYNDMEKARKEAFRKVMVAYDALKKALDEGKPEKEISTLLNRYVEAMKTSRDVEARFTPQLTRIVSVEKVAKLFVGEEEFRRMQIGRWNDRKD
ncbi:MAG: hypothetical protein ACI3ZP_10395 [Candidatus Cryptobacteroides sp.]